MHLSICLYVGIIVHEHLDLSQHLKEYIYFDILHPIDIYHLHHFSWKCFISLSHQLRMAQS